MGGGGGGRGAKLTKTFCIQLGKLNNEVSNNQMSTG